MKMRWLVILLTVMIILPQWAALAGDLCLVDVNPSIEYGNEGGPKLSGALDATRIGDGTFKGFDDRGRPLIVLTSTGVARLKSETGMVRSVIRETANDWHPVTGLVVGYHEGDRLTATDLDALGLRLKSDDRAGSFLIVEPLDGVIDAALLDKLARSPKIRSVTPLGKLKAID